MVKPKVIFIFIFTILINCIYSEQDNNTITWQGLYDGKDIIGFYANSPQNWIAIEDNNPQKPICYNFYIENNIYKEPSISIAIHVLNNSTDEALRERINIIFGNNDYTLTQIEYVYAITENNYVYDVYSSPIYFSRQVFIRYRQYGFQISLSTYYEKPNTELLIALEELINSLVFFENNR